MSRIYQYSIVRYLPFSETGEFANIGVVVLDTQADAIAFELAPKRFPRIRTFFDPAAHDAYGSAIETLRLDLGRVAEFLPSAGSWSAQHIFKEITQPRESSIVFSQVRVLQSVDDLHAVALRLFGRYVKREFATQQTPESVLTKDIRQALLQNGIKHFKHVKIEDDVVPMTFPLAYRGRELRAIKPLAFAQRNPLGVFDHGSSWHKRLSYLLERGKIEEGNLLIAVEGPEGGADEPMREAYSLALDELRALPFEVVEAEINGVVDPRIVRFAQETTPRQSHLIH